jgi:DNA-binding HxlR family transcriptional regulator
MRTTPAPETCAASAARARKIDQAVLLLTPYIGGYCLHAPEGRSHISTVPPPKRHPYDQWSPDARALDLVGDKWTLLIVRDLVAGPRRFVELQRVLPGISTEQLRSRLNRMVADGLLTRQRYREVPPRVDYELTERARQLMPVVGALARWGFDWTWGSPRDGEAIDVGAVLRLTPGLLAPPAALSGRVLCVVERPDEEPPVRHYELTAAGGRVEISERDLDGGADATITGTESGWVRAFGPDGDLGELHITGDKRLAEALLSGIVAAAARRAAA